MIQCRASDVHYVKEVMDSARKRYLEIMRTSTGKDYEITVEIDTVHLPPGPETEGHGLRCSGGVVLHSHNGKIRCINTLDERLNAIVAANTPALRKMLFS